MSSKLLLNAQESRDYVFPAKAGTGGSTGLCVLSCGGAESRVVLDHTVLFFLGVGRCGCAVIYLAIK